MFIDSFKENSSFLINDENIEFKSHNFPNYPDDLVQIKDFNMLKSHTRLGKSRLNDLARAAVKGHKMFFKWLENEKTTIVLFFDENYNWCIEDVLGGKISYMQREKIEKIIERMRSSKQNLAFLG